MPESLRPLNKHSTRSLEAKTSCSRQLSCDLDLPELVMPRSVNQIQSVEVVSAGSKQLETGRSTAVRQSSCSRSDHRNSRSDRFHKCHDAKLYIAARRPGDANATSNSDLRSTASPGRRTLTQI